jgi:hypothetical protein
MNSGFNLRTALHVAKRELITGHQYIVVGDGGTTICQSRSGAAVVFELNDSEGDSVDLSAEFYPNGNHGIGSLASLNLDSIGSNYYVPTVMTGRDTPKSSISDFFDLELVPVFLNEKLVWSDDVDFN